VLEQSRKGSNGDEHAANAVAAVWLQRADCDGSLSGFLSPSLTAEEREVAKFERRILGVI
jgi:hypothetical protein